VLHYSVPIGLQFFIDELVDSGHALNEPMLHQQLHHVISPRVVIVVTVGNHYSLNEHNGKPFVHLLCTFVLRRTV
jgi:hypothetical protein